MANSQTKPASAAASVAVWDVPVRLFHWSLVLTILSAWPSFRYSESLGDLTLQWHRYNGYAILVLLVFRVIWGFVGSSTARWSAFVRWPWTAAGYGLDILRGRDRKFLGHTPLGTYMVLALLAAAAGQACLGLMVVEHNETSWGPLYELISEASQKIVRRWHGMGLYYVILPLVCVHVIANALYGLVKHDPLITGMITGRKPAAEYEDASEAIIARSVTLRALATLILAIAIVFGGIKILGGNLIY